MAVSYILLFPVINGGSPCVSSVSVFVIARDAQKGFTVAVMREKEYITARIRRQLTPTLSHKWIGRVLDVQDVLGDQRLRGLTSSHHAADASIVHKVR